MTRIMMLIDRLHGHVDAIQKKKDKTACVMFVRARMACRLVRCELVKGAPGVAMERLLLQMSYVSDGPDERF